MRASIATSGAARVSTIHSSSSGGAGAVRRFAELVAWAPQVWRSTRSRYAMSRSRWMKRGRRSTRSNVSCTRSSASSREPHIAYAARISLGRC